MKDQLGSEGQALCPGPEAVCEEQQVHSTPSSDLVRRWAGGQKRDKTVSLPGNGLVMERVHWPAAPSAAEGPGSQGALETPFIKDQGDALLGPVPRLYHVRSGATHRLLQTLTSPAHPLPCRGSLSGDRPKLRLTEPAHSFSRCS